MTEVKPPVIHAPLQEPPPPNVKIGAGSLVLGEGIYRRFFSERDPAIEIGEHCHLEGVQLALGKRAYLRVGNHCYAANMIVLAEDEIRIGDRVFIGFNVALADTDSHPLDPATRLLDAIAISPIGAGRPRPPIATAPVTIEDDVYIGPNCVVLKGVTIGAGSFIEPGSVITRDVPARSRVLGNPAQVIGQV